MQDMLQKCLGKTQSENSILLLSTWETKLVQDVLKNVFV